MDRKPNETINDTIDNNDCNSNDSNSSSSDDKTYHFRKGSDLDGFESFGALFADGLFTDLAICCSGRVFRCHRVVMAASSAYIKNALSAFNGSENNNCNTVMILPQEIKVADIEAILQFIYNGQVEVTRDAIESFLSSAKALHIKGLANIKLVYNNNHKNLNNNNKNNKNSTNNSNPKTFNNENQNSQNFNHNNCNNNENNTNNNNSNNLTNNKKRNGIIGGTPNRSPKLKSDLNSNHKFAENIPQNQSFHSSVAQTTAQENDSKINQTTNRKKQKISPKALATNGFANNTKDTNATNGDFNGIDDEETQHSNIQNETENDMINTEIKMDSKDVDKSSAVTKTNGSEQTIPSMPCLIQIDADPTTFPSFCAENNGQKSAKRRRSSSLRLEAKNQKNCPNSLSKVNRNGEPIKQMIRTSNRKLGFIQFHKKSAQPVWNSSNKWKCEICNKLYGNKQTLKEHMDYFHSNKAEQIFTCTVCEKEYTWKKSLMKHYRDIHGANSTTVSQMMANNQVSKSSADDTSTDVPTLEWVTQSDKIIDSSSPTKY